MALDDLVGSTTQNNPNMFFGNANLNPTLGQPLGPYDQHPGWNNNSNPLGASPEFGGNLAKLRDIRDHGAWLGDGIGSGGGIMHTGIIGNGFYNNNAMPLPDFNIGIQQPMPQPDYSSQFENFGETLGGFGEQLTGFGDQMTGYQDALGSFNEQMGGMGKQFETVNNKLDSVEKGIGTLGNQLASFENTQKAQPQNVQPQRPAYNSFGSPFGFGGFGGLGSLFGRRY